MGSNEGGEEPTLFLIINNPESRTTHPSTSRFSTICLASWVLYRLSNESRASHRDSGAEVDRVLPRLIVWRSSVVDWMAGDIGFDIVEAGNYLITGLARIS